MTGTGRDLFPESIFLLINIQNKSIMIHMNHKCIRCGYGWPSKAAEPKCCPRCKSYRWQGSTTAVLEPPTVIQAEPRKPIDVKALVERAAGKTLARKGDDPYCPKCRMILCNCPK